MTKKDSKLDVTKRLELFLDRTAKLRKTRFVQTPSSLMLSFTSELGKGAKIELDEPDEEIVLACLTVLRQFLLEKEPIYLFNMYRLCLSRIDDDEARRAIRVGLEDWKRALKSSGLHFVHGDKHITPEYVKDLYLAYDFHSANEAANSVITNLGPLERTFYRREYLVFLQKAVFHITYLEYWIRRSLELGFVSETVLAHKEKQADS